MHTIIYAIYIIAHTCTFTMQIQINTFDPWDPLYLPSVPIETVHTCHLCSALQFCSSGCSVPACRGNSLHNFGKGFGRNTYTATQHLHRALPGSKPLLFPIEPCSSPLNLNYSLTPHSRTQIHPWLPVSMAIDRGARSRYWELQICLLPEPYLSQTWATETRVCLCESWYH